MLKNFLDLLNFILELVISKPGTPTPPPKPPVVPPVTPPPSPPPVTPPPPLSPLDQIRNDLIDIINKYRASRSLPQVHSDNLLTIAAQKHTDWMASAGKLSHTGNNAGPADRVSNAGYSWSAVGENIAMGYQTVEGVFNGWKNSPGHNAIMLGNYIEVGIGYNSSKGPYWTAVFAIPRTRSEALVALSSALYADPEEILIRAENETKS